MIKSSAKTHWNDERERKKQKICDPKNFVDILSRQSNFYRYLLFRLAQSIWASATHQWDRRARGGANLLMQIQSAQTHTRTHESFIPFLYRIKCARSMVGTQIVSMDIKCIHRSVFDQSIVVQKYIYCMFSIGDHIFIDLLIAKLWYMFVQTECADQWSVLQYA